MPKNSNSSRHSHPTSGADLFRARKRRRVFECISPGCNKPIPWDEFDALTDAEKWAKRKDFDFHIKRSTNIDGIKVYRFETRCKECRLEFDRRNRESKGTVSPRDESWLPGTPLHMYLYGMKTVPADEVDSL